MAYNSFRAEASYKKRVEKINAYEQSGFYQGKNMIMTFETSQYAISSYVIKNMIEQYLL